MRFTYTVCFFSSRKNSQIFQVTDERLAFHAAERETASRITSCPAISSSECAVRVKYKNERLFKIRFSLVECFTLRICTWQFLHESNEAFRYALEYFGQPEIHAITLRHS